MKNTKYTELQKKIIAHREMMTKIDSDISAEKSLIASLTEKIANYTDYENADVFNAMRREKSDAEGKLELLIRKRKAEEKLSAEDMRADFNQFFSERRSLLDKFDKDAAPEIEKLEALYNETRSDIQALQRLYSAWIEVYRITESEFITSLDRQEGLHGRVANFLSRERVVADIH